MKQKKRRRQSRQGSAPPDAISQRELTAFVDQLFRRCPPAPSPLDRAGRARTGITSDLWLCATGADGRSPAPVGRGASFQAGAYRVRRRISEAIRANAAFRSAEFAA